MPIYTLAARPSDAEPAGYLAPVQIDDPQTFHDQRPIEHQALGHRRSEEELGWLVEHRRAHLYERDDEAIGFSFVGSDGVGPVAAKEPSDLPFILICRVTPPA